MRSLIHGEAANRRHEVSRKLAPGKQALFHLPIEWAGPSGGRLPNRDLVIFARVVASLDKREMLHKVGTAFDSCAPAIAHTAVGRA